MISFAVGGTSPGGRLMGLVFFVLGSVLVLAAAGFALYTISWLATWDRTEGTVVAVHRGYAVVEGEMSSGDVVHIIDRVRTDPPPVLGSSRTLAMPPGHPGDAIVVGFMNTWFVSVLLGGIGAIFAFVGLLTMIFGASLRRRPSYSGGTYDEQPETTIINNYYRDDGTTYTS